MTRHLLPLALLLAALPARAQTVTVYGADTADLLPAYAHTWAVFEQSGEQVCINWGPRSGRVRPLGAPGPGANDTHAQALAEARRHRARVTAFGPYAVTPELFAAARRQRDRLESGAAGYQCLGIEAPNCIGAVADVAGPLWTGAACGARASKLVAEHLRGK